MSFTWTDSLPLWMCACVVIISALPYIPRLVKTLWEKCVLLSVPRDEYPNLPLPPGTFGYPLLGETHTLLLQGSRFFQKKMEQYGWMYKTHLFGNPTVRVIGAENVKAMLQGKKHLLAPCWPASTRILLGEGSLSQSTGSVHTIRRKQTKNSLNTNTLNSFVPLARDTVRETLEGWSNIRDFYAYPECKRLAFDVAVCTLLGLDRQTSLSKNMHDAFGDFTRNLFSLPFNLPGFGFRKGIQAKQCLLRNIQELFPDILEESISPVMRSHLESGGLPSTDLYERILDLLFAGYQTVASGLTSIMMFLGQNPTVVEKVREELNRHQLLIDETEIDFQVINRLEYVNNVVKEVLRLCPPIGAGYRKALQSFELGGFLIPKGWTIVFSIRETQHTSPLFENPSVFDPDRWEKIHQQSNEHGVPVERFHYIPFGNGQRACVGKVLSQLIMKIFLVELVRSFNWKLKNDNPEMDYIPVVVARDQLPLTLKSRSPVKV